MIFGVVWLGRHGLAWVRLVWGGLGSLGLGWRGSKKRRGARKQKSNKFKWNLTKIQNAWSHYLIFGVVWPGWHGLAWVRLAWGGLGSLGRVWRGSKKGGGARKLKGINFK